MKNTGSHLDASLRSASGIGLFILIVLVSSCGAPSPADNNMASRNFETEAFKSYWYEGKAEINTYALDQSRYGEQREGSAVLIFVTEDFSTNKHVKLDRPTESAEDKVNVLKLNFTKNFVTGIYPYSMMLSVFKPVQANYYPHSLKVTMTSQEWCGQVFSQLNLTGNEYAFTGHSYFEKEGEENFVLNESWLEDELWNQIRLEPLDLPTGEVEVVPGLFFTRLNHTTLRSFRASITSADSGNQAIYSVDYPELGRKLKISYQKNFPYQILGWEETFVDRGQTLVTRATLKKSMMIDYWTKNKNEFQYLRDSLGLSPHNF